MICVRRRRGERVGGGRGRGRGRGMVVVMGWGGWLWWWFGLVWFGWGCGGMLSWSHCWVGGWV